MLLVCTVEYAGGRAPEWARGAHGEWAWVRMHGDYACTGFGPELCLILVVERLEHRREVRALLKRSGEQRRAATQPLL